MKYPLSLKHYEVMKSIFVGIDVSKRTLDVCVKGSGKEQFFKIENKSSSIKNLFKELSKVDSCVVIAMENTGHYNHQLYKVLPNFNFTVYVVDPKHIKRSIGLVRGKNDKVDAKRIATFIERNNEDLDPWEPLSESVYSLKVLLTERKAEVARIKSLKQRIEGLNQQKSVSSVPKLITRNKKEIQRIQKRVKEIEKMIREEIAKESSLKREIDRIKTVPGIGDITAWMIAAKTHGFKRLLDPRKLACFAGVVPFDQQSGSSLKTKPRVSKMADRSLKTVLQMAAMRSVRMNNELQSYYQRKVEEGKNKMSVLNAVRNKLIHIAMALIKNKTYYQNRLVLS